MKPTMRQAAPETEPDDVRPEPPRTGSPVANRRRIAVTTCAVGVFMFGMLALLVPNSLTDVFDSTVLRTLRSLDDPNLPRGGRFASEMARDITSLGGVWVLALVVLLVAGYLAVDRRMRDAVLVLAAAGGGVVVDVGLKLLFARERPSIVPHLTVVHSASFPSGHAMLAAVIYPTLGALLARFSKRRANQVFPIAAAVGITFCVGFSRIVLGVHYPTDVIAGWSAGAAWAAFAWLVADRLARKGAVEGRQPDPAPVAEN